MHVPPGADEGTTAKSVGSNGQIASATMMWETAYQVTFLKILAKYPGVITLTLAGHTHMDEYRIIFPGNVLEITPSISPCFKNDPAFKVFAFDRDTFTPTDYSSLNYDLVTMPAEFNSYYTFSEAYSMQGSLGDSLAQLFSALATNNAKQALYRGHFESGNNPANPITNANWPVYWAGIGKMTLQDIIYSANSY
jgi:sphingomyelin phosphodiesterase acid-like 3